MMTKAMHAKEKLLLESLRDLQRTSEELSAVNLSSCSEPSDTQQNGDILIGTMPDDIRRVWAILEQVRVDLAEATQLLMQGERTNGFGQSTQRIHDECMVKLPQVCALLRDSIMAEFEFEKRPEIKGAGWLIFTSNWNIYMRPETDSNVVKTAKDTYPVAVMFRFA